MILFALRLQLLVHTWPLVLEEIETRWRYANQGTAIPGNSLHESTISGILPDRKPRT